jgi:hypothetical protein
MVIVIVLVVAAVALAVLLWLSARERDQKAEAGWTALRAGETPPARIQELSVIAVPPVVQDQAREVAKSGRRAQAVALVQKETSLTLRDAAGVVDGLRFGHTFPEQTPGGAETSA